MNKKVWLDEERKVFLANFSDSSMKKDADGQYSEVQDYWRIKTYVKNEEKFLIHQKREFPEPYQVAQYYCGGTWNDYNAPFTIQVSSCNLNCYFCFVSDELRQSKIGCYFSAKEVIDLWIKNTKGGVLRITGGEPFLAPEFLIDVGKEIEKLNHKNRYLWIDTNLLGKNYKRVAKTLSDFDIPFGITGCFKGYNEKDFVFNTNSSPELYFKQFTNAKTIITSLQNKGEAFFYIPEITQEIQDVKIAQLNISTFIDKLRKEIHPNAPLRTTILIIKEYEANKERFVKQRFESGKTRKIWFEELKKRYSIDLLWLPQYQIPLN